MTLEQIVHNKAFQYIAIEEAIKLIASKNGYTVEQVMSRFVEFRDEELIKQVAYLVAIGAKQVQKDFAN